MEAFEGGLAVEAVELMAKRGRWLIAAVQTSISWPAHWQVIRHGGLPFILRPRVDGASDANILLDVGSTGLDDQAALSRLFAFCSALSWAESERLVVRSWTYQRFPMRYGFTLAHGRSEVLGWCNLPDAPSAQAGTCLALMREARSSANPFYACFNYYKVVEHLVSGTDRAAWMQSAWPRITDGDALSRYSDLSATEPDVGVYVRDSVRKAVAHTSFQPFIDPDDASDWKRITLDLPLMERLALICIEDHCNLKDAESDWRPSLTPFLSDQTREFHDHVVEGANPSQFTGQVMVPDPLTVVVRRGSRVEAIKNFALAGLRIGADRKLTFELQSLTGRHSVELWVDIVGKDIGFEFYTSTQVPVSRDSVVEEIQIFLARVLHYLNGQIQVWAGDQCVMRGQQYLPLNTLLNREWMESEEERLGALLCSFDQ